MSLGFSKHSKADFQDREEEMGAYVSLLEILTKVFDQFETRRKYTLSLGFLPERWTDLASRMILKTPKDVD